LTEGQERPNNWLVTCDHATNAIPPEIGSLGLPEADMHRHIAFDPGAFGVASALGKALNAPVIGANFSRLVIDPNRGQDDPTLLMKLYDGTIIPGNRFADADELSRRKQLCYDPYHARLAELADRPDIAIVSIHSFTPQLRGRRPRPWHVGILYADDDRLAVPLMQRLHRHADLCVGDNQPYSGHLPGDAVDRHALQHGRPNVLIEFRQDLIATTQDQAEWAARLAPELEAARSHANL
jgi:predicted N-formylglutamate amidohydrolase